MSPVNQVSISGSLVKAPQLRYSPAGVPIGRLWIEHRSNQPEGGRERAVALRMEVRLTGAALCRGLERLDPGQPLRITGHLARPDQRSEPARLIVVAEEIELFERTN